MGRARGFIIGEREGKAPFLRPSHPEVREGGGPSLKLPGPQALQIVNSGDWDADELHTPGESCIRVLPAPRWGYWGEPPKTRSTGTGLGSPDG